MWLKLILNPARYQLKKGERNTEIWHINIEIRLLSWSFYKYSNEIKKTNSKIWFGKENKYTKGVITSGCSLFQIGVSLGWVEITQNFLNWLLEKKIFSLDCQTKQAKSSCDILTDCMTFLFDRELLTSRIFDQRQLMIQCMTFNPTGDLLGW